MNLNYSKLYKLIIENAKNQNRVKEDGNYYETHHITPLSSGGLDIDENKVNLTAREHFICHWILYKINPTKENAFSWWMMSNNGGSEFHRERRKQTSRKYEYARKAFSKHISEVNKGRKHTETAKKNMSDGCKNRRKRKLTDEHKEKLSIINKGENNGFYGKTHTEDVRKRISIAAKQRIGEKSNAYGMKHSQETKDKFSIMYKGKPRQIPHEVIKCPYCDKTGIKPNMKRWHFDNCKEKKFDF